MEADGTVQTLVNTEPTHKSIPLSHSELLKTAKCGQNSTCGRDSSTWATFPRRLITETAQRACGGMSPRTGAHGETEKMEPRMATDDDYPTGLNFIVSIIRR